MTEFIKTSHGRIMVITLFISIIFIVITFNWLIELSSFSVALAKAALGLILFWAFDKYAMKEIDTVEELKKGNIAYAIFILSIALVVSAAIINS